VSRGLLGSEIAATTIFDERDLPYQNTDAESRVTRLDCQPNGTLAQVTDGNGHTTGYAPCPPAPRPPRPPPSSTTSAGA
jgi:YD repeat-containing protein